ncbi:MAG: glucokinase [Caulobacterales bacterium 68-7]|nr:glucokinase [Caulobacterales bacterium]OJU07977.1 MAG: glucokinase [Caulobacterales bacterium 68-7]
MNVQLGLVGDIGGTNARFALASYQGGVLTLESPRSLPNREYGSLDAAAAAYLAEVAPSTRPEAAVLAVAGPVIDGSITFTNLHWSITEAQFRQRLGLEATTFINDFEALAHACPLLTGEGQTMLLGPNVPGTNGSIAVIGAGTGTGVSSLIRNGGQALAAPGEGGHVGFAPTDAVEIEILSELTAEFGRVSLERILCGQGMVNLHKVLRRIDGREDKAVTPADIVEAARNGSEGAKATIDRFCAILGTAAGDLALTVGAQGGVYIAGGVAARLKDFLPDSPFRTRFEDKGRFTNYMRAIPTRLVLTADTASLYGSAKVLLTQSDVWDPAQAVSAAPTA